MNLGERFYPVFIKSKAINQQRFFFGGRNIKWLENWQWAKGSQKMQEFLDFTTIDGTKAYTNIDLTQNRQGPQFVETLVNAMAVNEEYPCVTAIDSGSLSEKEQRKMDALFRMHEVDTIGDIQQQSGVAVEPPDAYVPDSELSAEVHFKQKDRLPKEIEFQEILRKVMNDNEYEILKRRTYRDLVVINCGVTKIEKLDSGFIGIRKPPPANVIYNFFMGDSGKLELSYIGETYSLKVRELRKKYGKSEKNTNGLNEKEIFNICQTATTLSVANRFNYYWTDNYLYATDRPYDDYNVAVFDCEIKVFDTDYYVAKKDNFGKENIQTKRGIPNPSSEKANVLTTNKYTVYRGVWAIKSDKMIFWGYPDVVIKPYMDISESLFSYTINIPNNDGDYVPSLFERALEPLRELTLAKLKRKQLIAEMVPAGYSFDVETSRDIDIGGGNIIGFDEILRIRNQKGVVFWSSRGLNPNETNRQPPIVEMPNAGSVPQLNELSNIIDRCMAEIRSLLGVPLYRDGSDLPPRMGQGVVENQTANSSNVTDFIKTAYTQLMQETLHKVCMIKWDEAVIKNNRNDLMDTVFQVGVEMKDTAYEKQLIEQNIAIWSKTIDGNGNPLLSPKDIFAIREIKDFKLQEMYLSDTVEKNKRDAEIDKAKREQANIQSQQQTAQQAGQQALQQQKEKIAAEKEMLEFKSTKDKELAFVNGWMQGIAKGVIPPDGIMQIIQQLIPNITIPLVQENKTMAQGIQMQAQQEQVAAMQQQGEQPMQ